MDQFIRLHRNNKNMSMPASDWVFLWPADPRYYVYGSFLYCSFI